AHRHYSPGTHGGRLQGAADGDAEQERVGLTVAGGAQHLRIDRVPQVVAAVRLLDPEDVPDPQVAVLAAAGGAQAAARLRVPGVVAELEERVLAGDALLEHDLDQGGGGPRPLDADVAAPAHEDAVVARDRGREVGGERAAGDEDEQRVGEPERVVVPEEVAGDGDRLVLAAVVDDGADVLEGVQVEGVAFVALQQEVGAAVAGLALLVGGRHEAWRLGGLLPHAQPAAVRDEVDDVVLVHAEQV